MIYSYVGFLHYNDINNLPTAMLEIIQVDYQLSYSVGNIVYIA